MLAEIVVDEKKKLITDRILNLELHKVNRNILSKRIFQRKTKNIFQVVDRLCHCIKENRAEWSKERLLKMFLKVARNR